ncbi:MAG TPA: hypothetical protein O0X21_02670 [Methanocorpusculum sp.]|nr:hypothetical protein [Methanocorpusculum sp.]
MMYSPFWVVLNQIFSAPADILLSIISAMAFSREYPIDRRDSRIRAGLGATIFFPVSASMIIHLLFYQVIKGYG